MSMGLSMLATVLGLLLAAGILDAAPYQELQPRAGYVPVYIREGETPLREIHPSLAEAFNEPFDRSDSDMSHLESSDEPNSSNSNDQAFMSEEQVDSIKEEPIIDTDISSEEVNKKIEETKEPNVNVAEAAKEAIKELVSVFEADMLEKLGLSEDVNPSKSPLEDKNAESEIKPEQPTIENQKTDEKDASKLLTKVDNSSTEKSSDVLTVEAFKAKDFNKESVRDDEIDIPEDVPSYQ